jgi:hypothetical protein
LRDWDIVISKRGKKIKRAKEKLNKRSEEKKQGGTAAQGIIKNTRSKKKRPAHSTRGQAPRLTGAGSELQPVTAPTREMKKNYALWKV